MRSTYKFLAYAMAVLVVVQAAAVAWGFFGVNDWIENENGVVDQAYLEAAGEGESDFLAEWGFAIHFFFVGFLLSQLLALLLLIVSFFARIPGGIAWAGGVLGLVVLQVWLLPMAANEVDPIFGALHGVNALILLGVALQAARRVDTVARTEEPRAPITA